jgi:undecaprenyl diphosphate synthase
MVEHIAFIMDGNRRYSVKNNLTKKEGYNAGMEQFFNFVKYQVKYEIFETSYFALSIDNYDKRGEDLKPIGELIKNFFKEDKFEEYFFENRIKINIRGDIDDIEEKERTFGEKLYFKDMKKRFEKYNSKIGDNFKYKVNIALNYDGHREILQSFKKILNKIKGGEIDENEVCENMIKNNISFSDSKAPEIIVRPGDAPRTSGFMLWDSKYSEIYLTKKLWPELDEEDFKEILNWYSTLQRNFGK